MANPYGSFTAKKATPNPYAAMASKRGAESGGAKSPAKVSRNGKVKDDDVLLFLYFVVGVTEGGV